MVMTPMMRTRTRTMRGMSKPERAGVVPIGLLVNRDRLGLIFNKYTPQGEREVNDRDD